jgi:hypothetical protein
LKPFYIHNRNTNTNKNYLLKKSLYLLGILLTLLTSCRPTTNEPVSDDAEVLVESIVDSTLVGIDKDENGCLASAGYTYSKVNKECVKAFTGIQLNPINKPTNEDETLSVYVLFDETGDKAEVFMPSQQSMILTREGEGKPWIYKNYQLIPYKGYIFKDGDKILYAGDGEVGQKVTGSYKDGDE